jgi:hypothetical protein
MNLNEQKAYYEWLKMRLWKAVFAGKDNKKTWKDLDYCTEALEKIRQSSNPRRPK